MSIIIMVQEFFFVCCPRATSGLLCTCIYGEKAKRQNPRTKLIVCLSARDGPRYSIKVQTREKNWAFLSTGSVGSVRGHKFITKDVAWDFKLVSQIATSFILLLDFGMGWSQVFLFIRAKQTRGQLWSAPSGGLFFGRNGIRTTRAAYQDQLIMSRNSIRGRPQVDIFSPTVQRKLHAKKSPKYSCDQPISKNRFLQLRSEQASIQKL